VRQRSLEWITWSVLIGVTAVIAVAFVRERSGRGPVPGIFGQVPPFHLTNQLGVLVGSEQLAGKVWIANAIFTRCPSLCPTLSAHFRGLQQEFAAEPDFRLVSLTADTEYDTPQVLKKHGDKYSARADRWWLLTGLKSDVQELGVNGLKFLMMENSETNRVDPNDLFLHGPYCVLVDRQGRIRGWFDATLPEKKEELLGAVRRVLKEH
jgi:protein SCO1